MNPKTVSPAEHTHSKRPGQLRRRLAKHFKEPIRTLLWYFELGVILLDHQPTTIYGTRWVRGELKADLGLRPDLSHKALAFAQAFVKKEVEQLQSLGIPWWAVVTILPVKKHRERMDLLRRAARQEWTIRELRRQMTQQRGLPREQETRTPPPPHSCGAPADLRQLAQKTAHWLRHVPLWEEAAKTLQSDPEKAGVAEKLPRMLSVLTNAVSELERMKDAAGPLVDKLIRLHRRLARRAKPTY